MRLGRPIPPPEAATITTQPSNQSVPVGQAATFTVVATGTVPITYQWSETGSTIAGATGASYTTPGVARQRQRIEIDSDRQQQR